VEELFKLIKKLFGGKAVKDDEYKLYNGATVKNDDCRKAWEAECDSYLLGYGEECAEYEEFEE